MHLPNSGVSSDCNEGFNLGSDRKPFSSYFRKAVRAVDQHLIEKIILFVQPSICNIIILSIYPEPIEVVLHDPVVLAVRIEQDAQAKKGAGAVGLQYPWFGGLLFSRLSAGRRIWCGCCWSFCCC